MIRPEDAMRQLLLCLLCVFALPAQAADWEIDAPLRLHYAYVYTSSFEPTQPESPPSLGLSPAFQPDINNIYLQDLSTLGFPVMAQADRKDKLYLKLYHYPASLDPEQSFFRVLKNFGLLEYPASSTLTTFASERSHLAVKHGWIAPEQTYSATQPIAPLQLDAGAQWTFDDEVMFTSLYVRPTKPAPCQQNSEALVDWSRTGMQAFHRELVAYYQATYPEVTAGGDPKWHSFIVRNDLLPGRFTNDPHLQVIRLPKQPLTFANWQDLPMPQGPHLFLSGLMLAFAEEYVLGPNDGPDIYLGYTRRSAQVLEIGAVHNTQSCAPPTNPPLDRP
jgi:hypothetical protein